MNEPHFHSIPRAILWFFRWRKFKVNRYFPGNFKAASEYQWRPRMWWALRGADQFTHMYMIHSRAMHVQNLRRDFIDLCDLLGGRRMVYEFERDPTRVIVFMESGELEMVARLNDQHALYQIMVEFVDSRE